MSVNARTDSLQHAELFGKPVLFTNWLLQRESVPQGWYCYDLQGTHRAPTAHISLVDEATAYHSGTVLSPAPLKRDGDVSRRVNNSFCLLGEEMTLEQFCEEHGLDCPQENQAFTLRPASPEEAGLFYAQPPEEDAALGAIGHVRIDFGHRGKGFWHTWHPRGPEELNSPEFKTELAEVVDELRRRGPLQDLDAMRHYCDSHGGAIEGGWVQNYGYIVETEHYRYCLRCNPVHGDYNAYLTAYDLQAQRMNQHPVGRVTYADGGEQTFTDAKKYLDIIREELPHRNATGFRHETLTDDPTVRKAVDDLLLDYAGEDNPRRLCNYGLTEHGKEALEDARNPNIPHTYDWFVMTDCGTPQEQLHRDLSLVGAILFYQNSDCPEKRIGVTKDGIATVDFVHMAEGEQRFFEDHRRLDSFKNDPVIQKSVEWLHQELEGPEMNMTFGGM